MEHSSKFIRSSCVFSTYYGINSFYADKYHSQCIHAKRYAAQP